MSPHYFHSVVDNVSKSVLGSPVLIYIDDCCGHKIDAAAFEVSQAEFFGCCLLTLTLNFVNLHEYVLHKLTQAFII